MLRRVALIAALFAITAEMLRASGPLLDAVGLPLAAVVALLLFAVPALPFARAPLPILLMILVGMRVAAAFFPILPLVGGAAVLGLICLTLTVRRGPDPVVAVLGLLAGGVVDLLVRLTTFTVDGSVVFLVFELLIVAVLGWDIPKPEIHNGRLWALGAYLAIWTFDGPAFAASQSGLSPELVIGVMMAGLIVSMELVRRMTIPGGTNTIPAPDHWIDGALALAGLLAGLWLAWWFTGPVSLAGIVLAQLTASVLITRAFAATGNRAMGAVGLVWVLPVLLFQLHYDKPLPVDNRLFILAVGVALGVAGMGRRREHPGAFRFGPGLLAPPSGVALLAVLALLVPFYFASSRPAFAVAERPGVGLRLLSWNIKYGSNLPDVAAAIKQAAPDVVMLQEVSRGWVIGGGQDAASYLSRELAMPYHWAPAADGQFGNLLLTRIPVKNVESGRLPFGQGPMHRSYLRATLSLSDGRSLDVLTTHLTHKKANTPTRLTQIERVIAKKPDIIAGDLNFWPSWEEFSLFKDYHSAQDSSVDRPVWTSPTDFPTNRVDYIFGNARVAFTDFHVLTEVKASDHFPLAATITLR